MSDSYPTIDLLLAQYIWESAKRLKLPGALELVALLDLELYPERMFLLN
jgi:hypothetical protein